MTDKNEIKIIADNRKARHNYFIEDTFECGVMLLGSEVKSLRDGRANIGDSYAVFKSGELFLVNAHINAYQQSSYQNHEPLRSRKLLLHRPELNRLWGQSEIKGNALIPLKIYFKGGLVKIEIGLGKGKKLHDKRQTEKERDAKRSMDRVKRHYK